MAMSLYKHVPYNLHLREFCDLSHLYFASSTSLVEHKHLLNCLSLKIIIVNHLPECFPSCFPTIWEVNRDDLFPNSTDCEINAQRS